MPLSTQRKVAIGFLLALAVLFASGVLAYRGLRQMEAANDAARESSDMLMALSDLEQTITDAETGQRGYLLTGERRFLAPYALAMQQLSHVAATVRATARPDQAMLVEHSIALMHRREAVMTATIADWNRGERELAVSTVRVGAGRAMMDSLRQNIGTLRAAERGRLDDRKDDVHAQVQQLGVVIALGMFIALAVAIVATALVARDERSREESQRALERTRDEAEAASRAKSDFLARMSHELRTPLNAVIGFAGVLLRNKHGALDDQALSYLGRIQASGTHLLTIINDILDLSRVESGRMDIENAPVDLVALVSDTLESYGGTLAGRDVRLTSDLPTSLAPVVTDANRLRQVITNLVGNAIKFTERGDVLVRLVPTRGGSAPWRLDVIDCGIGISRERQDAIFAPFEQAENSISRRFGGTGLGLSISRSICERLGFRLSVVSETGVGSTFSVLFDSTARAPERHERPSGGVTVGRGLHTSEMAVPAEPGAPSDTPLLVLIIDDSADSRLLLTQYMDDFGFQSIAAVNGEQGLQMALEFKPSLILVDLQMPGMDGWEVIRRLKSHRGTCDTPLVVVSIMTGNEPRTSPGVAAFVAKPVNRDGLRTIVEQHLAAPRALAGRGSAAR